MIPCRQIWFVWIVVLTLGVRQQVEALSIQQQPQPTAERRYIRGPGAGTRPRLMSNSSYASSHASLCGRRGSAASALADCVPCWLSQPEAPRLYIKETNEGFGTRFLNILMGMAVAAKMEMNLGGVITYCIAGHDHFDRDHGQDPLRLATGVLGLLRPEELFTSTPPPFDFEFRGIGELEKNKSKVLAKHGANVLLVASWNNGMSVDFDHLHGRELGEYLTPRFLGALRRPGTPLAAIPVTFAQNRPSVAMHIRRGDLLMSDGRTKSRTTPDEWYYSMVEMIRKKLPDADVHVFSSTAGRLKRGRFPPMHNESEFDGYRERGMAVHLDGDILEAWAHLARADVLVMAKSSFSYVPALLNPAACVISQAWWLHPMPDWIEVSDGWKQREPSRSVEEKVGACLTRIGYK